MNFSFQIEIKAPVPKVFEIIRNPESFINWIPDFISFEYSEESNHENIKGTKYKQVSASSIGEQHFEGEFTEFIINEKLSTLVQNTKITSEATNQLSSIDIGTLVIFEVKLSFHIFLLKLMSKSDSPTIKKQLQLQQEYEDTRAPFRFH